MRPTHALLAAAMLAQVVVNPFRPELRDEGTPQGRIAALNCAGAGVSCSVAAGVGTINVSGGGGGGGNFVEVTVDFAAGDTVASAVVTGQAWVSTSSVIVCAPTMLPTADRAEGMEDAAIEGLTPAVHTRVNGVGFTLTAAVAKGRAIGEFDFHCTGS